MNLKKTVPLVLVPIFVFAVVLFLTRDRSEERGGPDQSASLADDEKGETPPEPMEWDVRPSPLRDNPEYQKPAENPIASIMESRMILSGPEPFLGSRISADGKYLIASGDNYKGLWVANADGSDLKQISDGERAGWRPVTTAEGDLIFRTGEFDEEGNLVFTMHHYDFETGELEIIYEGVNEDLYPAWLTRDEDYILMRKDGDVIPHLLRENEDSPPLHERDEGFAFSDGGQVYFHHLSMKESMPLSTDTEATGGEAASPTGDHVAYLSGNSNSILIVDMQTGNEVDIGEGSNLSWSPDGRFLLYDMAIDDGHDILDSQIFIVESNGEGPQRLSFDGNSYIEPSWSPDGRYFIATDLHTGEVHRFDLSFAEDDP